MALVDITGLSHAYDETAVLSNITLTVSAGERLAILGANGSGKTTLAHTMSGWTAPNAGCPPVLFGGRAWQDMALPDRVRFVQFVGQLPAQHLSGRGFTVREEIAFGLENLCLPREEILDRIGAVLLACRLNALADRNPFTLSGGEQQRLAIATALALRPSLLVLDEPFTNLDPEGRDHVIAVLAALPRDIGLVLMETDPSNALKLADRFAFLDEGRIAAQGDARTVLLHPACRTVIGVPAIAEAYERRHGLQGNDLPLTVEEVRQRLGSAPAC